MKFALVNGKKVEATKGAKGVCQFCDSKVSAFCGEVYAAHWKLDKKCKCDSCKENETIWHRNWKDKFPYEWQEVVQFDESGEKHIADVKTESGAVLEFQHSYLKPEERRSRNAFYSNLIWVVDGLKRERDKLQFKIVLEESISENGNPYICRVRYLEECRLLKEWHNHSSLVFFDFQEKLQGSDLWLLLPAISNEQAYLTPFSRNQFIEFHNNNKFDELVKNTILPTYAELTKRKRVEQINNMQIRPNILPTIDRRLARRKRRL